MTARQGSDDSAELDIRLFGRLRVFRDGVEVHVPPPKPATALKLLALSGGVMHKDKLVAEVWPGEDLAVGRARLRNVLSKLRRATGANVQERNDTVCVLDHLRCDLVEFIQLASRALSGVDGPVESKRLVIAAQELWTGPPLEEDRYEPWAHKPRRRAFDLQERMWALLPPVRRPPGPPTSR